MRPTRISGHAAVIENHRPWRPGALMCQCPCRVVTRARRAGLRCRKDRARARRVLRVYEKRGATLKASELLVVPTSATLLAGCASLQVEPQATVPPASDIRRVAPQRAERPYSIMVPLLKGMNHPLTAKQVHVGIIEEPAINAANAGGGNFYVTTGLLAKANDTQLRGIMAHEVAHEDLGHVAQMQVLGAGLNVGVLLLEQLLPGSSAITPVAGELIARGCSRQEELEADHHAVEILGRAGYSKQTLIDALSWVAQSSGGGGGGGFLSTHPATKGRIATLKG